MYIKANSNITKCIFFIDPNIWDQAYPNIYQKCISTKSAPNIKQTKKNEFPEIERK